MKHSFVSTLSEKLAWPPPFIQITSNFLYRLYILSSPQEAANEIILIMLSWMVFFDKNNIGYFAIVDIEIEMKLIRFMSLFKNIGKNSLIAHLHYLGIHYTIILGLTGGFFFFFYKLLKIHTGVGVEKCYSSTILQVRVHEFLVSKYQSTWQDIWYIRSRKQEPLET